MESQALLPAALAESQKQISQITADVKQNEPLPVDSSLQLFNAQSHDQTVCRRREVEGLCAFQRRALITLEAELAVIDSDILKAEANVMEASNRVQALRGLVQKRSFAGLDHAASCSSQVPTFSKEDHLPRDLRYAEGENRLKRRSRSVKLQNTTLGPKSGGSPVSYLANELNSVTCSFSLPTVGTIYSDFSKRFEAPRQSFQGPAGHAAIVLKNANGIDAVKECCNGKSKCYIWILYWLDRNAGFWREKVRPPRARGGWRVGLFATRSPHRPTAVGLSLAEVVRIELGGNARIHVRGVDILDETPLVAWKLYNYETEAHLNLKSGWLDDTDRLQPLYYDEADSLTRDSSSFELCKVIFSDEVREKLEYVDEKSVIDVFDMVRKALSRVSLTDNGQVRSADGRSDCRFGPDSELYGRGNVYPIGAWRIWYHWDNELQAVVVSNVTSGIREEVLQQEGLVDREVREHKDFMLRFGGTHCI